MSWRNTTSRGGLKARRQLQLLPAICVLTLNGVLAFAAAEAEEIAPCSCLRPTVRSGDVEAVAAWVYEGLEIPHLSKTYAKRDLFIDGLEGDASSRWPCLENPEAGRYTATLSTTSPAAFFDVFVFLVPAKVGDRTMFAAQSLGAEVSQGSVLLSFEIPDGTDPQEWVLLFLFDEDVCYTLDYRDCLALASPTTRTLGTLTLVKD